jgi:hypothetical protein
MTAMEWHAQQIEIAAKMLAHFLMSTEAGRRTWSPEGLNQAFGRSALEMVVECINVNNRTAAMLNGSPPAAEVSFDTEEQAEEAAVALLASGRAFAEAVRSLPEEKLVQEFAMPWGASWSGALLVSVPTANMHYHVGQINYIQTLYGDKVFHTEGLPF